MALTDEVTSRFSTQRLVELTNPDNRDATTINTALLALAAADATADFEVRAGVIYDNTVAKHVMAGVKGVVYFLKSYIGVLSDDFSAAEAAWADAVDGIAMVTSRNRIKPKTSSILLPTPERTDVETVRPDTDRPHFDGVSTAPAGVTFSPSREGSRGNR